MSDPRADVSLVGIKNYRMTFKIDNLTITYDATKVNGSTQVGLAVTLTSGVAKQIELVADGEFVLGKLIEVTKDNMGVVERGMVTLPGGTSATLTRGKAIVGDLLVAAEGYIREVATATAAELGVQQGSIIDPATTTAVVVWLP